MVPTTVGSYPLLFFNSTRQAIALPREVSGETSTALQMDSPGCFSFRRKR
jgi:hypothetical protein